MGYRISEVLNTVPVEYKDGKLLVGLQGFTTETDIPALSKHTFPYQCNQIISDLTICYMHNDTYTCYLRRTGTGMLVANETRAVVKNFEWMMNNKNTHDEVTYGGSISGGKLLLYRGNFQGIEMLSNPQFPATIMFKGEDNPEYIETCALSKNIGDPHIYLERQEDKSVLVKAIHSYGKTLFKFNNVHTFWTGGFILLE